jgi:DegV family protein with EDD domain
MSKVRIVTDSTADLPAEILEKYQIEVVPLNIHIDNEVYKENVEISSDEFFVKLPLAKALPRSSQPSPADFIGVYKSVLDQADSIISIHISENLSGTLGAASIAARSLEGADITIVNSQHVSMGLGLIVLEAAKAAAAGADKEEILRVIDDAKENVRVIFVVDTLEYLEKNGRIGKAQAFLGSILSIKPVLGVQGGFIVPVEKMRGSKKALKRLVEIARDQVPGSRIRAALVHGAAPEKVDFVLENLRSVFDEVEVIRASVGPIVGLHAGPGVMGFMYFVRN